MLDILPKIQMSLGALNLDLDLYMILYQLQAWSELKENRTLQHDKLVKSRSILLKDRGQRRTWTWI